MTDAELGYAAGLLDGEGCISVYPKVLYDSRKGRSRPRKTRHLSLSLSITNTCEEMVWWLHERLGGTISCRKHSNHFKDLWHWSLYGRPAAQFLHSVEPLLVIKREEAQTAILFGETIDWPLEPTGRAGGRTLSPEAVRIRDLCYRHLHSLKTKGHRYALMRTRENGRAALVA